MKKNILKNLLVGCAMMALFVVPVFSFALTAQAQDLFGQEYAGEIGLGGEDSDPRELAARIIQVALGFLGIVAVAIILLGGFKWMTASGNEDKVDEAKKLIQAGVIGLIIIIAAWAIANWVINTLMSVVEG